MGSDHTDDGYAPYRNGWGASMQHRRLRIWKGSRKFYAYLKNQKSSMIQFWTAKTDSRIQDQEMRLDNGLWGDQGRDTIRSSLTIEETGGDTQVCGCIPDT